MAQYHHQSWTMDDDDQFQTSLQFQAISSYSTVLAKTTGNIARKISEILPNEPPSTMVPYHLGTVQSPVTLPLDCRLSAHFCRRYSELGICEKKKGGKPPHSGLQRYGRNRLPCTDDSSRLGLFTESPCEKMVQWRKGRRCISGRTPNVTQAGKAAAPSVTIDGHSVVNIL